MHPLVTGPELLLQHTAGDLASGTAVGYGAVGAGAGGWGYCPADFEAQLRWRVGGALSHMPTDTNKLDEDFQNGTCQF